MIGILIALAGVVTCVTVGLMFFSAFWLDDGFSQHFEEDTWVEFEHDLAGEEKFHHGPNKQTPCLVELLGDDGWEECNPDFSKHLLNAIVGGPVRFQFRSGLAYHVDVENYVVTPIADPSGTKRFRTRPRESAGVDVVIDVWEIFVNGAWNPLPTSAVTRIQEADMLGLKAIEYREDHCDYKVDLVNMTFTSKMARRVCQLRRQRVMRAV